MRLVWVVIPILLIGIIGVQESFAENTPNTSTVIKNGIILTLETDKSQYTQDELIHFTMTLENSNSFPFEYKGKSGCNGTNESNMGFLITELERHVRLLSEDMPVNLDDSEYYAPTCTTAIVDVVLGEYEKVEKNFVWNQSFESFARSDSGRYLDDKITSKIFPGTYTFNGWLDDVSDDGFENPLVTELKIKINDYKKVAL